MSYQVSMVDNQTGERRMVTMDFDWHDASEFWWTEGNFACDCNRYTTFYETEPSEDGEDKCGDTRFRVEYALLPTGERVELDGPQGNPEEVREIPKIPEGEFDVQVGDLVTFGKEPGKWRCVKQAQPGQATGSVFEPVLDDERIRELEEFRKKLDAEEVTCG